jgi:hypothetical protein
MGIIDDQDDERFDDDIETQRDTIRESLNEIANDIGMAMRDVGLRFPVFLSRIALLKSRSAPGIL